VAMNKKKEITLIVLVYVMQMILDDKDGLWIKHYNNKFIFGKIKTN
jgi:hypothetical protein